MAKTTAIADTGFVVALLNSQDPEHSNVAATYTTYSKITLPQPALTEVTYLLGRNAGIPIVVKFLRSLSASRFQVIPIEDRDTERIAEILEIYQDSRFDFLDACIMTVAEQLSIQTVLTLDRRDFGIFRPRHCQSFTLLP